MADWFEALEDATGLTDMTILGLNPSTLESAGSNTAWGETHRPVL